MCYKYLNHGLKCFVALPTALFLMAAGGYHICHTHWLAGVLCLLLGVVFTAVAALYGTVVRIDARGVRCTLLGMTVRDETWEELQEVGVVGTKVFNNSDPTGKPGTAEPLKSRDPKIGTPYIYFSRKTLTEQERFALALKWPPLGMTFLRFTEERSTVVQIFWDKYIERYNTGKLRI